MKGLLRLKSGDAKRRIQGLSKKLNASAGTLVRKSGDV